MWEWEIILPLNFFLFARSHWPMLRGLSVWTDGSKYFNKLICIRIYSGPFWASFILIAYFHIFSLSFVLNLQRSWFRGEPREKTGNVHISLWRLDPWTPEVPHEWLNWTYYWPTKLYTNNSRRPERTPSWTKGRKQVSDSLENHFKVNRLKIAEQHITGQTYQIEKTLHI